MKILRVLLLLSFTISCKDAERNLIEINPEKISDNQITLSDIADDITYVPLDNDYPMNIFYRIEIFNDTIYIDEKNNGMFALDMSGKMIRTYGGRGRGPGEYVYGLRFTIDRKGRVLYLLDRKNILKYSLNGRYLGNISLEKYIGHFREIKFNDSLLLAFDFIGFGEAVYDWIVIDTAGNLISVKHNFISPFKCKYGANGGVYEFENNICFWNFYNDTVFSISADLTYKASCLFSQGDFRFPKSDIEINQIGDYFHPNFVFETKRFLINGYWYKKNAIILIEKRSLKSFRTTWDGSYGGLLNDLDGGAPFEPEHYFEKAGREYLVGYTQPMNIITRLRSDDFKNYTPRYPEKKEALTRIAENIKETDNALLTIVRLKK